MNALAITECIYSWDYLCYDSPTLKNDSLITDLDLASLKKGSHSAFQKIYEAYFSLLRFTCSRMRLSNADTEEVIQETFMKLLNKASTIQNASAIKSWLVVAARNTAIDRIRRQKFIASGDPQDFKDYLIDSSLETDDTGIRLDLAVMEHLLKELLPSDDYDLIDAFYFKNKTAKEISEVRNIAISTVTTKLTRIRRFLADGIRKRTGGHYG